MNTIIPGVIIIEGHVQGLSNTRSLGEAGIPVFVVDKNDCIARYSKYCTKFIRCPDFILDDFYEFLIELAIKENIKKWILIPSNDHAVYTISKFKTKLEKYYKVITPGLNIIEKIYDKAKLIEIAKQLNVPVPVTQLVTLEDEPLKNGLNYPMIIKGRNGLSFYKALGKKALIANNEKDLRRHFKLIGNKYQIDKTFIQELIHFNGKNKTISFTAFCLNGEIKTHWSGVKIREHPMRFGTATFTKSIYNATCHQQSIPLIKALNYTGVCEVEYLQDPRSGEYKLIEINPRTWLWVGLARACGVNYARIIYDYMNGNTMHFSKSTAKNLYWINPITDTAYSLVSILSGKLNPATYFATLIKGVKVNALFAKGDMKPGWAYFFRVVTFIRQR